MVEVILEQISTWIIVLPLLVGIVNLPGLNSDSRWIFTLVLLGFVTQASFAFYRNAPLQTITYNLYTPVELLILFRIFQTKCNSLAGRRILAGTLVVYSLICLLVLLRNGLAARFIGELVALNNLLYMIWILLLLKQEYNVPYTLITPRNPFTWYLIALIVYAPCTLAIFALDRHFSAPAHPLLQQLSIVHSIFNILEYFFFSLGLLLPKQIKYFSYFENNR